MENLGLAISGCAKTILTKHITLKYQLLFARALISDEEDFVNALVIIEARDLITIN